jgi:hypothetical protein
VPAPPLGAGQERFLWEERQAKKLDKDGCPCVEEVDAEVLVLGAGMAGVTVALRLKVRPSAAPR